MQEVIVPEFAGGAESYLVRPGLKHCPRYLETQAVPAICLLLPMIV